MIDFVRREGMKTTRTKKLLSYLMIALIVILSAEGMSRLFLVLFAKQDTIPRSIGEFNELLGWWHKPNAQATTNTVGFEVEYKINSKRLRDDEASYVKPNGIFRIVLVGDSRTFGFGVPIEKHFSKLLEGYFENVEVINMGVAGFGVDQELLMLRYEGVKYHPDLVLAYVAHYSNYRHLHTVRWGKEKPKFQVKEGNLVLMNSPVTLASGLESKMHTWLFQNVKLYAILDRVRKRFKKSPAELNFEHDEKNLKDPAFKVKSYTLGARIVQEMNEVAKQQKAAFLVVTQVPDLHERMLAQGIQSIDVTTALDNPGFSLPNGLGHINESGNGVLAREVAKYLKSNRLIPETYWKESEYVRYSEKTPF